MHKAFFVFQGFDLDDEWAKALRQFHRRIVGRPVAVLTGVLGPKRYRHDSDLALTMEKHAAAISEAFLKIDVEARPISCQRPDWPTLVMEFDSIVLDLAGTYGANGTIQGFLDVYNLTYTGPRTHAQAVSYDRLAVKGILASIGVATFEFVGPSDDINQLIDEYRRRGYNVPACFRSRSGGVRRGNPIIDYDETAAARAIEGDDGLLLERYTGGPMISVSAIEISDGWLLMPPLIHEGDALSSSKFFNHNVSRAELSNNVIHDLFKRVKEVIVAFQCGGAATVYFSKGDPPKVVDVNMSPALGPEDPLTYVAALIGIPHETLLLNILAAAYRVNRLTKRG